MNSSVQFVPPISKAKPSTAQAPNLSMYRHISPSVTDRADYLENKDSPFWLPFNERFRLELAYLNDPKVGPPPPDSRLQHFGYLLGCSHSSATKLLKPLTGLKSVLDTRHRWHDIFARKAVQSSAPLEPLFAGRIVGAVEVCLELNTDQRVMTALSFYPGALHFDDLGGLKNNASRPAVGYHHFMEAVASAAFTTQSTFEQATMMLSSYATARTDIAASAKSRWPALLTRTRLLFQMHAIGGVVENIQGLESELGHPLQEEHILVRKRQAMVADFFAAFQSDSFLVSCANEPSFRLRSPLQPSQRLNQI